MKAAEEWVNFHILENQTRKFVSFPDAVTSKSVVKREEYKKRVFMSTKLK